MEERLPAKPAVVMTSGMSDGQVFMETSGGLSLQYQQLGGTGLQGDRSWFRDKKKLCKMPSCWNVLEAKMVSLVPLATHWEWSKMVRL